MRTRTSFLLTHHHFSQVACTTAYFFIILIGLPFWIVWYYSQKLAWDAFRFEHLIDENYVFREHSFLGRNVFRMIISDPLTFAFMPRVWRTNGWRWIDAATYIVVLAVLISGFAVELGESSSSVESNHHTNLSVTAIILLWLKLVGYLRSMSIKFAAFVLMLAQIVGDLRELSFAVALLITLSWP